MTAIIDHEAPIMEPPHRTLIGDCRYCDAKLYEDAPFVQFPNGTISHVACEINARRQNRGG